MLQNELHDTRDREEELKIQLAELRQGCDHSKYTDCIARQHEELTRLRNVTETQQQIISHYETKKNETNKRIERNTKIVGLNCNIYRQNGRSRLVLTRLSNVIM